MISSFLSLLLAATPEVALLSSSHDVGELRFQALGAETLSEPTVRFRHVEGSPVLGSVLPGTRVVVATAVTKAHRDDSFSSALLRLEAGKPPRILAEGVAYGARPLVTSEGRVFVARGVAGPETTHFRVDALSLDEVNPNTGKARTVYSTRGYVTFLAGAAGRELIVYEVGEAGAKLFAVHADTMGRRVLLPAMNAQAHDFVVDASGKRVLFTQGAEDHWQVESVSLLDGARQVLFEGPEVTLLPFVRASGAVVVSQGEGKGLITLDGKPSLEARGTGFERLRFERQGLLIGLHERPSEFPSIYALGSESAPLVLQFPAASRLDFAGVTQ